MNHPVIPRIFPTMIAPKVSRRFHDALSIIGLWSLFVGAFKLYARIVPVSKIIYLDGIDGGPRREYLCRWHLIPRNPWFNLYLHKFVHGDDDRAKHDHPWRSWSLLLDNGYREHTSEWCYETPLGSSASDISDHTHYLHSLFTPTDGRRYVDGSVARNKGKFPGMHCFDYTQDFRAGDFRALTSDHMHIIELFGNNDEECWTLFMTGRMQRRWGFAVGGEEGWRDFAKFLSPHPTRPNSTLGAE